MTTPTPIKRYTLTPTNEHSSDFRLGVKHLKTIGAKFNPETKLWTWEGRLNIIEHNGIRRINAQCVKIVKEELI